MCSCQSLAQSWPCPNYRIVVMAVLETGGNLFVSILMTSSHILLFDDVCDGRQCRHTVLQQEQSPISSSLVVAFSFELDHCSANTH